jgi:Ca-activated chloride channel family protein
MVRPIQSIKAKVKFRRLGCIVDIRHVPAVLFAVVSILANLSISRAESLASKNKEGNLLYAQGKYEEAEKAYLDAEVNSPGKPEVLYNLGNSLIKQKKYNEGVQALHQSISKGDKGTKSNSWYNTGDALFSMGNYKDSAEAFIQALKLDPADKDAKHNLELSLLKLKQQEQKQSNASQKQQNPGNSAPEQPSTGKEGQKPPNKQNQEGAGKENKQNESAKKQPGQANQRAGSISKEKAAQILDAVQNQELEQQRKLLEHRARQRTNEKDW